MIKKQPYTAPEAETLVVRFEGALMGASDELSGSGFTDSKASIDDQSDANWW